MSTSDFDRVQFDRDDDLRALLRSGDPAGSLSPADPAALASLLEDIMSADLDVLPEADEGTRATGTHGRNRLTWLVAAAAAAAVIAGTGGIAISALSGDDAAPPQATDHRTTTSAGNDDALAPLTGETTELTAVAPQGRCAVPTADLISQYPQAFQGTVTAVDGNTVTLQTSDVFTGEVGETVQVTSNPAGFAALLKSVDFQVGQSYLVAAQDGQLSMCGFSGKATGELRSLYDEAFVR